MIHITTFAGARPAVSPWLLQPHQAVIAHNARLRSGTLEPFDGPALVATASANVLGLYLPSDGRHGPAPLVTFPYPVSVTEGPGPGAGSHWDDLAVWPLNGHAPFRQDRYVSTTTWPLVVPAPNRMLVATISSRPSDASIEPDERSYTYTWVDRFSVESPPAPPTAAVRAYDGWVFTLTHFGPPPANAVAVRVYRGSSKMELGDKDANFDPQLGIETSFQLVQEVALPLGSNTYVDNRRLRDLDFGTLQTIDDQPPPAGMEQVVLTGEGYTVGFRGSELYVSERHEPWNWPEKNRVELPDRIVGIMAYTHVAARYGHIMTHDLVYVMTTGKPYRMSVAWKQGPANISEVNIQPVPFDENYPCLDKHSIARTNDGVMYTSPKGIVELKFQGPAVLYSRHYFDEDYFMAYAPNLAAWQNGRYFATSNPSGRGFVLDDRTGPEGGKDLGDFVTIDLDAIVLHAGHDGNVYYAKGTHVYKWNAATTPMAYRWRSKVFRSPGLINFGAAKIVADWGGPVTFTLYTAGVAVYSRTVQGSTAFRLPALTKQIEWQVQVEGSTVVREVHVAKTIADLADERTGSQRDQKDKAQ